MDANPDYAEYEWTLTMHFDTPAEMKAWCTNFRTQVARSARAYSYVFCPEVQKIKQLDYFSNLYSLLFPSGNSGKPVFSGAVIRTWTLRNRKQLDFGCTV